MPRGLLVWLGVSVTVLALTLGVLTYIAGVSPSPVWRLIVLNLFAYLPYTATLIIAWNVRHILRAAWPVIVISLGLRLILVAAPPTYSDDVHRYVWDGKMVAAGINPYRHAPDALELELLRDEWWSKINHRSLRTIYPPLAEAVFGAVALVRPHPTAFKLLGALADTAVVCLLMLLAGGRLRRLDGHSETQSKAVYVGLIYGLCPLPCIETSMSGHFEPLASSLVLIVLINLKKARGSRASFFLGLAAGIKLIPALLLPILGRRFRLAWLVFPLVFGSLYLPFISAGWEVFEMQDTFIRRWEGNAGLFALVKTGLRAAIEAVAGASDADTIVHIQILDPIARGLEGTFFSLHKDGGFEPTTPGAFTVGDLSLAMSKAILGLVIVTVVVIVTIRKVEPVRAVAWTLGALLICTPILHPWYLLWVLPLAALLRWWPWFVLAATAPLSYVALDPWWSRGVWETPWWVPWLEYGVFIIATIVFIAIRKKWVDQSRSRIQT
ncbi:MAG: DUF2029 domain-containing protein [Deltaproteobacteria bacterium]|nr:DUF2029 domain-containing protein [Deltaproteobacteria bacterium]